MNLNRQYFILLAYKLICVFRQNPIVPQEIINNDLDSLNSSNFNSSRPTKVFVHGWRMDGFESKAVVIIREGIKSCRNLGRWAV